LLNATPKLDMSLILDTLDDEIAVVDYQGRIIAVNAAWRNFATENGATTLEAFVGWNYFDVCAAAGNDAAAIGTALRNAIEHGTASRIEYPCHAPDGQERWFEVTIKPVELPSGPCAILRHSNVTARRIAIDQADSAQVHAGLLSALVETSFDAIISYDLDGRIMSWNSAAERLYGHTAAQAIGQSMEFLYPAGFTKRIGEYRDEIIAGKLQSFEATRMSRSGRARLVWITAAPIRDAAGNVIAVSNIHRDITEQRRHEESRQIVAQEVIHRAKNMLTVISAIHRRTAAQATSMQEFNEKFGERIASLSRSTDFLTSENWQTVSLDALIRSQLSLFTRDDAEVGISGPAVDLRPQAVKTLGMALHELGTNATKYGALGDGGGGVSIRWEVAADQPGEGGALILEWIETGQSFGVAPGHRGFGSTVLTRLAVTLLDAKVDYDFGKAGLRWRIEIPAAHFSRRDENVLAGAKD
jgi:PAS domain S-box-containing protein